jgi:ankyrin repeat protein
LAVVKYLLSVGADVTVVDGDGKRALHNAACEGHVDVVRALVEGGADVSACDASGKTALELAREETGSAAVVAYLDGLQ